MQGKEAPSPHHPLLLEILAKELGVKVEDIVDFELNVCDTQDGVIGGKLSLSGLPICIASRFASALCCLIVCSTKSCGPG